MLRSLLPTEPEVAGLLALMLMTDARRTARFADGVLVPLTEQDRATWDGASIAEGLALVRECLAVNRPGVYQIQAAVNAVHSTARTSDDTDWSQIAALYAQLSAISPSPVVELNRAVAVSGSTAPPSAWPPSTGSPSRATTPGTSPAPSCCAASAAPTTPGRRTTPPSPSSTTPPKPRTSPAAAPS